VSSRDEDDVQEKGRCKAALHDHLAGVNVLSWDYRREFISDAKHRLVATTLLVHREHLESVAAGRCIYGKQHRR